MAESGLLRKYLLDSAENTEDITTVQKEPVLEVSYCRFCAKKAKYSDLLDLAKDVSTHTQYILILNFFKIDFVDTSLDNKLPWTTCLPCYHACQNAYTFFQKVKASQTVLMNIIHGIKSEKQDVHEETESVMFLDVSTQFADNGERFTEQTDTNTDTTEDSFNYMPPDVRVEIKEPSNDKVSLNTIKQDPEMSKTPKSLDSIPNVKPGVSQTQTRLKRTRKTKRECTKFIKYRTKGKQDYSWTSYVWSCVHCGMKLKSMADVRLHSKDDHNKCFGFNCIDCKDEFNQFNAFVEHVRQHRDVLRYFCPFCNMKFNNPTDSQNHAAQHWVGEEEICELCGDIFPNTNALKNHKRQYKRRRLPRRAYAKKPKLVDVASEVSWENYSWMCQDCNVKCETVGELRQHVRTVHEKCFAIRCADCLKLMLHYRHFVEHVWKHRPQLKKHCQYCSAYCEDEEQLTAHLEEHLTGPRKPCDGCGEIFEDNAQLSSHMMQYESPRSHKAATEDDLTCDLCGKVFANIMAIRRHREIHNERSRDHTCDECGAAFYDKHLLAGHLKTHKPEPQNCIICKRVFKNPRRLREHVKLHSKIEDFSCEQCGKIFHKRKILENHIMTHTGEMPFSCSVCMKQFRLKSNLKTHMHQHTGEKPYPCKVCDKAFTNWANCNKHMIRIHNVPLAKTKRTEFGTVAIDAATGRPVEVEFDDNARMWMEKVLESKLKRKRTSVV